jgi:3',5'-cyclic AMP phosphodiesterase CpdA
MRILHLSDTHLERAEGPNRFGVDPAESLRLMLTELRHLRDFDAVAVTGDIADDGSAEACRAVRELVMEYAQDRAVPAFFTTGNHDERGPFAAALGSGHIDPDGRDRAADVIASADGERAAVSTVDGWRYVTLDSLIPGKIHGSISETQLDWLRSTLASPATRGTVLAFHHPPIGLDNAVQRTMGLANPAALAAAIRGTDVRVILTGHFHLQLFGFLETVPVWVTPGVVSRIDLTAVPGTERAVRGPSASLIDLSTPNAPLFHTFHARDAHFGETVHESTEDQVKIAIAEHGPAYERSAGRSSIRGCGRCRSARPKASRTHHGSTASSHRRSTGTGWHTPMCLALRPRRLSRSAFTRPWTTSRSARTRRLRLPAVPQGSHWFDGSRLQTLPR